MKSVLKRFGRFILNLNFVSAVYAILFGIMFGFIVMLLVNPSGAFGGLATILFGGFYNGIKGVGDILVVAATLILTGLSVGFAFKTGLFNIGASGQMAAGAFLAIYVGVKWTFLGDFQWVVAVIAGLIGGAIWGLIPGLLKAFFNVHEVVATIMMNWIAIYGAFIAYSRADLIGGTTQNAQKVTASGSLPSWFLDDLFQNNAINIGIIIALITAIVIYIVLYKTTFGYELRAVGLNKDAARYAGINAKRNVALSMMIAGALAGLAAAVLYLNLNGATYKIDVNSIPEGFEGIAVSLLGLSTPFGTVAAGLFFAYLKVGGDELFAWGFDRNLIGIIMASIIYFSALGMFFNRLALKTLGRLFGGDEE
ncbi:MAG: ABC transporter permease [Bacilli bacterium]|nr:ABC transporter permease [Bacilli bacterium]MBN2695984.1 ABC transporter permease [Bacilli bacterium]